MHFRKSHNEIYDIGTKVLNLQCLNCPQNQLFCKSIIPEEIESPGPVLSFGSVKTRFKAICDIFSKNCMRPWIRSLRFYDFFTFCLPSKSCFGKMFWQPFVYLINSKVSTHLWNLLNLSDRQNVAKTFFQKHDLLQI